MNREANQLWCRDVFEGCTYVGQGEDIGEVLAQFMAHARRVTTPRPFSANRPDLLCERAVAMIREKECPCSNFWTSPERMQHLSGS